MRKKSRSSSPAFTLVELLTVIAIMSIFGVIMAPALMGLTGAGKFNSNISQIAGILDDARTYALARNTYVWVAFYPLDPSSVTTDSSGDELFVATFSSSDGTDPFASGEATGSSFPIPYTVPNSMTTISSLIKLNGFKQLRLVTGNYFTQTQIPSLPDSMAQPASPASTPVFSIKASSPSVTLSTQPLPSNASNPISVVEFTPSGSAQVGPGLTSYIGLDFQAMKSSGIPDANNLAALRINGLVGLTTVYRK